MTIEDKKPKKPCWFFWQHEWSKWEMGNAEMGNATRTVTRDVLVQTRRCDRCGRRQISIIREE